MEPSRLKKLIRRYRSGKASPAERYIVNRWLESFQRDEGGYPGLDKPEQLALFHQRVVNRAFPTAKPRIGYHYRWAAAALVCCVLTVSAMLYFRQPVGDPSKAPDAAVQTARTGVRQLKRLVLPDSTVVYLNANTSLAVPAGFGTDERTVTLSGEAYFEVKRDTLRPFKVHAEGVEVEVLGTVFNVSAYPALNDVQVAVMDGEVRVSDKHRILALLRAAERLTYNQRTARFQKMQVPAVDADSWREGISVLADASFDKLTQVMHNYYGIGLESTDDQVRTAVYHFTVRSTRTLDQTMEQLCEMLKKKYRKEGNQVIIY